MFKHFLALFISFIYSLAGQFPETVITPYGIINGFTETLSSGNQVQLFRGIPYAKPPVGNLRFEKPLPPDPWTSILNATTFGKDCVQFIGFPYSGITDSEDCLYMNIARPANVSNDPNGYPVALYLYGGAYVTGSPQSVENPITYENIVENGIIFVSINYRLGPLGYYSSRDLNAFGNYASWDQIQALKFIQDVAQYFGGDKNRVTLFGVSAGGVHTSYLTYSNASSGLFHRAVPMCGNAHALSAQSINNDLSSEKLEILTGCNNASDVKQCLKDLDIATLVNYSAPVSYVASDTIDFTLWGPRIDGDLINGNTLVEALSNVPPIDTLVTIDSNEGISFTVNTGILDPNAIYYPVQEADAPYFNKTDFDAALTYLLSQRNAYIPNTSTAIQNVINFYETVKTQFTHDQYVQTYSQFFSDIQFNVGVTRELLVKSTYSSSNTYFYEYDYVAPQYYNPLFDGAEHCMDSKYLFNFINSTTDPTTAQIKTLIIDFFVTFVKTGTPSSGTTAIPLFTPSNKSYFYIGSTQHVSSNPFADTANFWDNLANNYGFDWTTGKPT